MRPTPGVRALALCFLPLAACGGSTAARAPAPTVIAQRAGVIEARDLGPAYHRGSITRITGDGQGAILATAKGPGQYLAISAEGVLRWSIDDCGRDGETCLGLGLKASFTEEEILLVDSRGRRLRAVDRSGNERSRTALSAVFDAVRDPSGDVYVFPGSDGFLLDVLDRSLRYQSSIVPLPESEVPIGPASCHLLADPDGGVIALWNPTRTIYRIAPDGEKRGEFSIDAPEVAANMELRQKRLEREAIPEGAQASIQPFVELTRDADGAIAAVYVFDETPDEIPASAEPGDRKTSAAVFRYTPDGTPIDVIRGLEGVSSVAFGRQGEIFGLEREAGRIVRFTLGTSNHETRGGVSE